MLFCQGETIKQFMTQVADLQEELLSLSKTYAESANQLKKHEAALEKEKQHNAQVKRKYKVKVTAQVKCKYKVKMTAY